MPPGSSKMLSRAKSKVPTLGPCDPGLESGAIASGACLWNSTGGSPLCMRPGSSLQAASLLRLHGDNGRVNLPEMSVGKIHVSLPVIRRHSVPATPDVVSDAAEDRLFTGRHFSSPETVTCNQSVCRVCTFGCKKFPPWIGPEVFLCACDVDRSGRHQGDELMLVYGEFFLILVIGVKVAAEPVRERAVDSSHRFPEYPLAQCCASTP